MQPLVAPRRMKTARSGVFVGNTKPLFTRAHPPEPPSTPPMSLRATVPIPRLASTLVAGQPCRQPQQLVPAGVLVRDEQRGAVSCLTGMGC